MSLPIQADGLVERYGDTVALNGVDLAVPAGTVVGVLGPNGAGKTTTVRILATLLRPGARHATVAGYDVVAEPVRGLVADGTAVLLTTRYLDEADQLADSVTVIDHARVVAEGRTDELKRRVSGQTLQARMAALADFTSVSRILATLTGVEPIADPEIGLLTVPAPDPAVLSALVRKLDEHDITADELTLRLPSLDDGQHGRGRRAEHRCLEGGLRPVPRHAGLRCSSGCSCAARSRYRAP